MQIRRNASALALELRLFCIKPSIFIFLLSKTPNNRAHQLSTLWEHLYCNWNLFIRVGLHICHRIFLWNIYIYIWILKLRILISRNALALWPVCVPYGGAPSLVRFVLATRTGFCVTVDRFRVIFLCRYSVELLCIVCGSTLVSHKEAVAALVLHKGVSDLHGGH